MKLSHPTGSQPKSVSIVALGYSKQDHDVIQLSKGVELPKVDEVWTVNRGMRCIRHDLVFVLDALDRECAEDPAYGEAIATHDKPIITSEAGALVDKPHIHQYPLAAIGGWCGSHGVRPYLVNSVPMMLAYAGCLGVEEVYVCGADYVRPDGSVIESGRACVEYWIGVLEALGRRVGVSTNCSLVGQREFAPGYIYGYDLQYRARPILERAVEQGRQRLPLERRNRARKEVEKGNQNEIPSVPSLVRHSLLAATEDFDGRWSAPCGEILDAEACIEAQTNNLEPEAVTCAGCREEVGLPPVYHAIWDRKLTHETSGCGLKSTQAHHLLFAKISERITCSQCLEAKERANA